MSTITEASYKRYLNHQEAEDVSAHLTISGANGLEIPFLGYVELNFKINGCAFRNMGFLVVKDPLEPSVVDRKTRVPGVLGSNVLRDMKRTLQLEAGKESIKDLAKEHSWANVLAMYEETVVQDQKPMHSKVRLAGKKPILIPARSLQVVEGTTRPASKEPYNAIIEENYAHQLHNGLMVAPAFVSVDSRGVVPFQIANLTNSDIYVQPRTPRCDFGFSDVYTILC